MRKVLTIIIGSLLVCTVVGAQQTQTGSIEGIITSEDGAALPGVTVVATAPVLPRPRSTVSDAEGRYRLTAMPPDNYTVTFTMPGFATDKREFPVSLQQKAVVDVIMRAATFEDEIIVTSETPTIDTTSAELKASVPEKAIENLPVGQEYRDLIKLVPGVQYTEDAIRGPSAGGSGQDNSYEFDGVSVTLPMYGTLSTQPATQDVLEMAIVKGGANAVGFNRSGGMLVNTLSKSGTNEFHGGVNYQFQTDSMTASVEDPNADATYDPSYDWLTANLGGPILKEMLYFYVSYYRPTVTRTNVANAYGDVPDYKSVRDEYFGKLTFTPTNSLMFTGSYRDSKTNESNASVGSYEAASTSSGSDSSLKIAVVEGSWVITDNSLLSFKYSDFKNPGSTEPDNIFTFDVGLGDSLNINDLANQGYFVVPELRDGQPDYNAFVAPLIAQYGYIQDGVPQGGGAVGGYYRFDNDDFYNTSYQVGFDYYLGIHELHAGYKYELGEEDLIRYSNGWGYIDVPGNIDDDYPDGTYYRAQVYQQSLRGSGGNALVPPLHSEYKSQNVELNDAIRLDKWTINVGVVLSNDTYYGQGLAPADTISGFVVDQGNKYEMYDIGWGEMISPRLGVTYSANGKDALYASYARYYPPTSSLPRAASWDRNINAEIDVYFDDNGDYIGSEPLAASSGKFFQDGIDPRHTDEYIVGYDWQINNAWTGLFHARYRHATDFWEDTWNWDRERADAPDNIPNEPYIPDLNEWRDQLGGGSSYVIAQLDGAFTKYYELSAELEWRGRNAFVRGSYVWSHYYGNFDQDGTTTNNDGNIFYGSSYIADGNGRQLWNNRYGDLHGDRRHQFKVYGYYNLPWNANVGAFAIYQSGSPWEPWDGSIYGSSIDTSRYAEPAGIYTTDSHYQLDLSYTQNFTFGQRYNILLRGEVFNVTNNQTGYDIQQKVNEAGYGDPRRYYLPRRFQVTVGFQF